MGEEDRGLDEQRRQSGEERAAEGEQEEYGEVIDLDSQEDDLERAMQDAAAAVESAESHRRVDVGRLEQELADLRDRSMRTLADFDNYRKRAERERTEIRRYALLEPMRDLLEVVDNLERAASAGGSADDLRQGVEMILRQLHELLQRYGVTPVETEGRPFDPNVHEAVGRRESAEVEEPMVDQELQKGYVLHDRLLRPARVMVAVPADEADGDERQEGEPAS